VTCDCCNDPLLEMYFLNKEQQTVLCRNCWQEMIDTWEVVNVGNGNGACGEAARGDN
jgi:hypothetical protein